MVKSFDEASRGGIPLLSGGRLHPIPIGNKGDWPYLATSLSFYVFIFCVLGLSLFLHPVGSCGGSSVRPIQPHPLSTSKATSAGLVRSYRNVPRRESSTKTCAGICHLCLGGRPGYDYEHMFLDYLCTGGGLG